MAARPEPERTDRHGFTLIEMLVVMAVVALLLSVAAPRYVEHVDRAREAALRSNLAAMRVFGLPLYIAMPWKETTQHDELLEIVIRNRPEFGRVHYPAKVRSFEHRLAAD